MIGAVTTVRATGGGPGGQEGSPGLRPSSLPNFQMGANTENMGRETAPYPFVCMAPVASSSAVVAGVVLFLLLAGATVSHGSFEGRRILSDGDGHGKGIVASWRRLLVDSPLPDAAPPANNSLVLAAARTHRPDPLTNLTMYSGGWNINDQHYWASVTFTAVPLFLAAMLWLLGFGVVLLVISSCCCFCRNKNNTAGCWILHCGQELFHGSAINTVDYVVGQGNLTFDNLRNFSNSLAAAKTIKVDEVFLPADVQQMIDAIEVKLNSSANVLSTRALDNSKKIKNVMVPACTRQDLEIVGHIMLGLAVLGFLFSILGWRFLVSLMVIAGWIILAVTILSSAVFLLLHNVMADACVAMDEWVTHPQAHTALDDILPCMDAATANESMFRSQEVTAQLVALVNNVVVNISNRDFPPALRPLYFNQSGPLMPVLCNPFNADMTPRACAAGEVDFDSAPREWKRFECQKVGPSGSETCVTQGRVTPAAYGQMIAAASIRETFTSISDNNCPGLERYSRHVYIGLLVISGAMMLSIVFWMVHTRQRRRRSMRKR
ncbi:hypothetical protein PR202_ga26378 [Eleusine coracana subsp. coracana]|uniref:Uncharacterized protein n=1 Tax=Eleusine coracana subsp. coracana TaxID=191504 RepID=A0AAV5DBS6_ELECO|nr:hypothetical protein PR202_ga26378 [Eleusine coracana subsp. coracana]